MAIWPDVEYVEIVADGLKVRIPDRRTYVLTGEQVMSTRDWVANTAIAEELAPLVDEAYVIGSCLEPGLIVDAIREGARAGYAI